MTKKNNVVEREDKAKDPVALRVTSEAVDYEILSDDYHVFPGSCLTVCCLTLRNGFTVTGESACVSPERFNAEIGQKIARDKAREKIWPLLGFRMKDQIARGEL